MGGMLHQLQIRRGVIPLQAGSIYIIYLPNHILLEKATNGSSINSAYLIYLDLFFMVHTNGWMIDHGGQLMMENG